MIAWLKRAASWVWAHRWQVLTLGLGAVVAYLVTRSGPAVGVPPSRGRSDAAEVALRLTRERAAELEELARRAARHREEVDRARIEAARMRPGGVESLADDLTGGRRDGGAAAGVVRGAVGAGDAGRDGGAARTRGRPVP